MSKQIHKSVFPSFSLEKDVEESDNVKWYVNANIKQYWKKKKESDWFLIK